MRTDRLALAAILTVGAVVAQDPPARVARLNLLNGPVSFQPASVNDWTAATPNYPLTTGDHLYTDQGGRAEMRMGPDAIRLNSFTNFGFLNLDDQVVQMRLTEGAVNIRVRELREGEVWEVDTPNGAVSLLQNGEYRIDTDPNRNATMVTVRAGFAEVNANGQAFPVRTRQTAYFAGDGQQENVQDANAFDDFDSFSQDLDRRADAIPPPRYVSRQMVGYEDLDQYGAWDQGGEYGPEWRPRVRAGWAPYHEGRWAWRDPWGWTWIDDAPWGFAPFHYGRWAYDRGGWGWFPGPVVVARPVYAPALVAFVGGAGFNVSVGVGGRGGEGIGWFPLGPREVYSPAYHVSPGYVRQVNITNVTNIRQVGNTYVNRSVPGAFAAVSRQDFVSARPVQHGAFAVPQGAIMSAPVSGFAPAVAPQRESVFGRQQVGGVARPQQAIFNRPVIARTPPPPAAVAFGARQQAIEANQGRPLAPQQLQTLRSQQAGVQQPVIRPSGGNQGFGRPQPAMVQPPQPSPVQGGGNFGRQQQNELHTVPQPFGQNSGFGRAQQPANPQNAPDRMQSRPPQSTQQDAPNRGFGRPQQAAPEQQAAPGNTPQEAPNRGFGRPQQVAPEQQAAPRNTPQEAPNRGFGRPQQAAPEPQAAPRSAPQEAPNRGFGRPQQAAPEPQAAPRSTPQEAPNRGFGRPQQQERPASPPAPQAAHPQNQGFGRQAAPVRTEPKQEKPKDDRPKN